ncbi:MAG: carbohydrate ABC transporter permease [Nitrososphaeria archaeon]
MNKSKFRFSNIIYVLLLFIVVVWTFIPLYWTLTAAFKSRLEVVAWPPTLIPAKPTLNWFIEVWFDRPNINYYINSILAMFGSALLALALGIPAAYGCARYRFRGRQDVLFTILTFRFLPPATVVMPLYIIGKTFHLIDTTLFLSILYGGMNIPIVTWVMLSYFKEIPVELEESFQLDGFSLFETFRRVTLPLARPGIFAVSMLVIAFSFGEFLFASILTTSPVAKTLPVSIAEYMGGEWGYMWNQMAALTVYGLIPLIIIFFIVRKNLVRGLTFGAVR